MSEFKAVCDEAVPIAAPVVIVKAGTDETPAHIRVADPAVGDEIAGIALEHGRVGDVVLVLDGGEGFKSTEE